MGPWLAAVAAGGLWTGILLAGLGDRGPGVGWAAAMLGAGLVSLASAAIVGRRQVGGRVLIRTAASFILLGVGWAWLHAAHSERSPLAILAGRSVTVRGTLEAEPEPGTYGWTASVRTDLMLVSAPGWPAAIAVRDLLWVQGRGPPPMLSSGDRVELDGTLEPLRGEFGTYLRRRGYPATLRGLHSRRLSGPSWSLQGLARAMRSGLGRSVGRLFPGREGGLLMGLLLGDTSRLERGVEEDFRATGLSHLTAVSGQNLVMFVAPLLGLAAATGMGRWGRFAVGLCSVGFFVLLAGGEPSVMRAAAMAGLTLLGVLLGRPRSPPGILGGAVLFLLAGDPGLAHAVGFQLSVAATAGIALLAGPIGARLAFLPKGLALAAGATLGAQAGVTPLLLYHFGVVPVVAIPANLVAFPAVGPAMMLGLAAGTVGLVWHEAGHAVAWLARIPLAYLVTVADRLARSPLPSITSPGGQLLVLLAGVAMVVSAAWWIRPRRNLPSGALLAAGVLLVLFTGSGALRAGGPAGLTVTFFDVGQGDAALVRSPHGATVLIDGGPDPDDVARELAALGVRRLDLVVATHAHADHVAGLSTVMSRFPVSLVVDPGCDAESPYHADFVRAVREAGVAFEHPLTGALFTLSDLRIEVLGPDQCFSGTESDPNNDSLVLRASVGASAVLFPGDVEESAQRDMLLEEATLLRVPVLKVPHHGGGTSLAEFFRAVGAHLAVVSVGPNRYGHPADEVLAELTTLGARVLRTDQLGDITVRFRGGNALVSSDR